MLLYTIFVNDKKYTVTNDMLRVNQDNNPSQYLWPIDFTASPSGVRMQYHLQSSGLSSNISGTPYMQNFSEAIYLDDVHLKFTLNNGSSNEYYDQNFQARKLVIKLANSIYKNVPSNELYFTFSLNNADSYVDVLEVTPANISTQRFYMSQYLDKFGDSVNTYDIVFSVCADGSLILHVNDIPIDIATANLISTTDTDITSPVYLYIAACTDYTDIIYRITPPPIIGQSAFPINLMGFVCAIAYNLPGRLQIPLEFPICKALTVPFSLKRQN